MTNFEIAMLLVLIAYGVIFGIICSGLFRRIRWNESSIKITNKVLDSHNSRIDGVVNRMDLLVQIIGDQLDELKKGGIKIHCGEQMDFPNTFDEFAKDYGFSDKKKIYTNGSELIPVFRVKQWLEHISL